MGRWRGTVAEAVLERRRHRLAERLPGVSEIIRGSVVERRMRCGKSSCRCRTDPEAAHGPYRLLMTTVGRGRTRTLLLPAGEVARVRAAVARYKRVEALLEQLSEVNWAVLRTRTDAARGRGR